MDIKPATSDAPAECLLSTFRLSKHYPGVQALDDIDFELLAGEVHVLFGENGAGKSTLISILAGAVQPSAGEIGIKGEPAHLSSVRDARAKGISAVFQEFSLVPTLTVAENLCLGEEPRYAAVPLLDKAALRGRAQRLLNELGFEIDCDSLVSHLSRAQQQMVEIAKSLRGNVSVLILDEPTASLTDQETQSLFELVKRLQDQGVGIIYISHRIQEIKQIANRITVLRDGQKIATVAAEDASEERLIELMTGRSIAKIYPQIASKPGQTVLEVHDLWSRNGVRNASIHVRRGEVVGIAGLVGSGKSELVRALYGLSKVTQGRVLFKGQDRTNATTAQMLADGFFYLPPDRKAEGLVLNFRSSEDMVLPILAGPLRGPAGWLRQGLSRQLARSSAQRVELTTRNLYRAVGLLSGGNQQKVMFAKGFTQSATLYVFDEPTVGVDMGTRSALYGLIQALCESGAAVVIVSSDLPEILHLTHRTYVMCRGELSGELHPPHITESRLLNLFFEPARLAA
ncbi:MAG TPA: sugar ABC transporter ATP-binding protein [Ramlibacter sp.]|nr:sugar ABC transporter ATP-binding protein [Ramlibacter sp.]